MLENFEKEGYKISQNHEDLDIKMIHNFIKNSYWGKDRTEEGTIKSIKHATCFGLFHQDKQVGFTRVISDLVTIAYLSDVFILDNYQGKGLGKWFMNHILLYPLFKDVKSWYLITKDAQNFYSQLGFDQFELKDRNWMKKIIL